MKKIIIFIVISCITYTCFANSPANEKNYGKEENQKILKERGTDIQELLELEKFLVKKGLKSAEIKEFELFLIENNISLKALKKGINLKESDGMKKMRDKKDEGMTLGDLYNF